LKQDIEYFDEDCWSLDKNELSEELDTNFDDQFPIEQTFDLKLLTVLKHSNCPIDESKLEAVVASVSVDGRVVSDASDLLKYTPSTFEDNLILSIKSMDDVTK